MFPTEEEIYNANKAKGFWAMREDIPEKMANSGHFTEEEVDFVERAIRDQQRMLIVSEVAEATEADRKGRVTTATNEELKHMETLYKEGDYEEFKKVFEEKIKDTVEDETADTYIRVKDYSGGNKIRLLQHVKLKLAYNSLRGQMHGKKS